MENEKPTECAGPQSWPALVWRIVSTRKPLLISSTVMAILVIGYITVRALGFDPIANVLASAGIGKTTPVESIDIHGRWDYVCTAIGNPYYQHGGTAVITQENTPYGMEWKLSGHRRWYKQADSSGKVTTHTLATPFYWETDWAAITDRDSMKFTYSITTNDGVVNGYAYGDIKRQNGLPSKMEGMFYQLPPFKPLHGTLELTKVSSP